MIKLITGKKGSGKTKILIDQINEAVRDTNGSVVCVEKGSNVRYSISRKVRWCDTEYYNISGYDTFYGFIAGLLASNYDITHIYIDGILRIAERDYEQLGNLLEKLDKLTGEDVTIVFTVSADAADLSDNVKQFIK
ncbi:MAG: ATP-binding protein [Ruminococcus sp.]|nr:ATP-binding protein [Ruminococcus sp.]MBR6385792.1 ATP-binding protein [Ruminococcus sp.]